METISVQTRAKTELVDISAEVRRVLESRGLRDGLVCIYVPHTTAGVTINEGADPAVKRDILAVFNEVIPWTFDYHHMEGNSPAHIKASLMGSSVQVIVQDGKLCLGTWQKIFFCEFDGPRNRNAWVQFVG